MAKEKDRTEVGITGKPVPKPRTAKQQYELEKKRRQRKHLGKNVGGTQYSSDVNPYFNPGSVREEVLSYLLDGGFASDEKSAEAILGVMSEDWKQSIVEGYGEKEEDCVDKKDKNKHNCAKKVCHEEFGEGTCIYGQHAEPDRNGFVSYYDVLFEHGIEKEVPTIEMKILVSESHGTHMKK